MTHVLSKLPVFYMHYQMVIPSKLGGFVNDSKESRFEDDHLFTAVDFLRFCCVARCVGRGMAVTESMSYNESRGHRLINQVI